METHMELVGLKTRNELEKFVWAVGRGSWKVGGESHQYAGLTCLKTKPSN